MLKKLSMVVEKLFLQMSKNRDEESILPASEDLNQKCRTIEVKLNLGIEYFPFVMQLVMRVLNKAFEGLLEGLEASDQKNNFVDMIRNAMTNFTESLYRRYFFILRKGDIFSGIKKDKKNLEVFNYKPADKEKLKETFLKKKIEGQKLSLMDENYLKGFDAKDEINFEKTHFKPYLPAAEYIKVILNDIATVFKLLKFEHHQHVVLSYYNWALYGYIQVIVDKFKDDLNDFNMNSLKKTLGFKDLLTSDYTYAQFKKFLDLEQLDKKEKAYLTEDEYLKALVATYGGLNSQIGSIPVQAFREDKYQQIGENSSIIFQFFSNIKLSFNRNFQEFLDFM
jgi:hypothetical protein